MSHASLDRVTREHMRIITRECHLRHERYHTYYFTTTVSFLLAVFKSSCSIFTVMYNTMLSNFATLLTNCMRHVTIIAHDKWCCNKIRYSTNFVHHQEAPVIVYMYNNKYAILYTYVRMFKEFCVGRSKNKIVLYFP